MVYDVGAMPFPVAFRLLAFLPVPSNPMATNRRSGAMDERWFLLNVSPELRETIATGLTLEFIQRLRADLVLTPSGERAWFVSHGPAEEKEVTLAALNYMARKNVLPQQLAQQDGATLRQLIAEATRGVRAVWIWAFTGELVWFATVLKSVARTDEPADRRTTCCNQITLCDVEGAERGASTVIIRFVTHDSVALACSAGHADCLSVLRERDPKVDAAEVDPMTNCTPAEVATSGGHGECLAMLRQWGVDLAAVKRRGDHCGHLAAKHGRVPILRLLHEWGVNLAAPGEDGMHPAHHAAVRGRVAALSFLREIGCADEALEDRDDRRLVHHAAASGQVDVLRLLYDWGFDLAWQAPSNGRTPAFLAAQAGRDDCLQQLRDWGVLNTNELTRSGENLAHAAAEGGHLSTLKLLHSFGVDMARADVVCRTPCSVARNYMHHECMRWIASVGGH